MKEDKKLLKLFLIIAVLVSFIKLPEIVQLVAESSPQYSYIKETEFMRSLNEYEKIRDILWVKIKGSTFEQSSIFALAETKVKGVKTDRNSTSTIPVKEHEKLTPPLKFLIIGDSMVLVGFGPAIENMLISYNGISVVREGQYSTGLNRIDYFDWYSYTDQLIAQHNPVIYLARSLRPCLVFWTFVNVNPCSLLF